MELKAAKSAQTEAESAGGQKAGCPVIDRRYLAAPQRDKGLGGSAGGTAGKRIGLYGGSFNPPHSGHLLAAETALKRLRLDSVWWLVSPGNPLKDARELAPLGERIKAAETLVRGAAQDAGAHIQITAFEQTLGTRGTAEMLRLVIAANPRTRFVWLMGADSLADFHLWRDWRMIMDIVPVAVINRPPYDGAAEQSPAARAFASARLDEGQAETLAQHSPPAWLFLHGKRSGLSSTVLRKQKNSGAGCLREREGAAAMQDPAARPADIKKPQNR